MPSIFLFRRQHDPVAQHGGAISTISSGMTKSLPLSAAVALAAFMSAREARGEARDTMRVVSCFVNDGSDEFDQFRLDADLLNHFPVETDIVPANHFLNLLKQFFMAMRLMTLQYLHFLREVGVPNFYFEKENGRVAPLASGMYLPVRWGFGWRAR